ncbi:MAG: hypothetical protein F4060_16850 [Holophagales bacterium]|nr:hypothetical protein [Holophagales bacterium]MYG30650.1 hypothetical protein [Holophagales bacterium]MYI81590.1 hypothetical protein [Holophagales bacterium]
MSSEHGRRRPLRLAATGAVLLVLLASLGCGLKGDPLPPIRPPEPVAEEVPVETEATDEESEDADSAADDSDDEEDGDSAQGAA